MLDPASSSKRTRLPSSSSWSANWRRCVAAALSNGRRRGLERAGSPGSAADDSVLQINAFYYQRESALKVRLRTLIDKRKLLTASLSDASGKVKALSRDSSSYGALYEGFRNFERDLGRLQVRRDGSKETSPSGAAHLTLRRRPTSSSTRQPSARSAKSGTRLAVGKRIALVTSDVSECAAHREARGADSPSSPSSAQQGEHDGQLYLARQVEVQPVFNREFIAELSDGRTSALRLTSTIADPAPSAVASANLLSLENLVGNEGKRRGPEALADGTGIETNGAPSGTIWTMDIERADSAEALEDLEHALVVAVKSNDRTATKEILKILLPESQTEIRAPVSRILWRAVLEEDEPKKAEVNGDATAVNGEAAAPAESAIPTSLLDFAFVDDINGRTSLHEVRLRRRILMSDPS